MYEYVKKSDMSYDVKQYIQVPTSDNGLKISSLTGL